MSGVGMMFETHRLAVGARDNRDLDPVSRLAVLEALGIVASRIVSNVDEFNRDSAEKWQAEITAMADDARKAMPEEAWALAVGHAMHSGMSKERIANLVTLFS